MKAALQLYSMRDCADQIALLAQLPALGITRVEGYGGVYGDPAGFRDAMDANGITMATGHLGLADLESDFDATMELVNVLGITQLFAPFLDESERPSTSTGWVDLGQRLNVIANKCAQHGIKFGWHNHDFEFVSLSDGSTPMDIILKAAPDIIWEADLAWIVRGGRDPLEYIKQYSDRITAVHVKDNAPDGTNLVEDGWSDLGAGTIDWAALLKACQNASPDMIYVLEHDKPADPVGYAARSAQAFSALWENSNV